MEKYSITVSTQADACFMNEMIEQMVSKKIFRKEFVGFTLLDVEGYPLHVGVNYTSDPFVRRCVDEDGGWAWIRIEPMSKKFNLRKEFSKFRFCEGINVFMDYPSDECFIYNLYLKNKELVTIEFDDTYGPSRKYRVCVNYPYYENGEQGLRVRKEESHHQLVFLETSSAKIAFNMVNRIVANMRYPKAKNIW